MLPPPPSSSSATLVQPIQNKSTCKPTSTLRDRRRLPPTFFLSFNSHHRARDAIPPRRTKDSERKRKATGRWVVGSESTRTQTPSPLSLPPPLPLPHPAGKETTTTSKQGLTLRERRRLPATFFISFAGSNHHRYSHPTGQPHVGNVPRRVNTKTTVQVRVVSPAARHGTDGVFRLDAVLSSPASDEVTVDAGNEEAIHHDTDSEKMSAIQAWVTAARIGDGFVSPSQRATPPGCDVDVDGWVDESEVVDGDGELERLGVVLEAVWEPMSKLEDGKGVDTVAVSVGSGDVDGEVGGVGNVQSTKPPMATPMLKPIPATTVAHGASWATTTGPMHGALPRRKRRNGMVAGAVVGIGGGRS